MNRSILVSRVSALALAAWAFLGPAPSSAADKLTIGLVTPISITTAPFSFGKELGFYKEEDIEIDLLPFNGTGTLVPQMTAKRVDIGYPNPDFLILARQPGKDHLPLRFFYNVARQSVWEITVPAASKYQSLKDLKGTRLGVFTLSQGSIPITRAMFKDVGLEVGKDVELIAVGAAATAAQALNGKQVDALNLFDTINATLETSGTPLRKLPIDGKYLSLFSNGYIAHEDTIKAKASQLAKFGRAWTKSVIACDANREACVQAFWREYPNQKPSSDADKQLPLQVSVLRARLEKLSVEGDPSKPKFGVYSEQVWRNFIELLHDNGQIATKDIDLNSLFTNEFVDQFNAFDAAAVVAKAKAAK